MGFDKGKLHLRNAEYLWRVSKLPELKCKGCGSLMYDKVRFSELFLNEIERIMSDSLTGAEISFKGITEPEVNTFICLRKGCSKYNIPIPDYVYSKELDEMEIPLSVLQDFDAAFNNLVRRELIIITKKTERVEA